MLPMYAERYFILHACGCYLCCLSLTKQSCVFYGNNKVYDSPTENKQFLTVKMMKSGCDLVVCKL